MAKGALAMQEPITPVLDGANLIEAALSEPATPKFDGHSRGVLRRLEAEEAGVQEIIENIAKRRQRATDDYNLALTRALDARDHDLQECAAEERDAMRALSAIGTALDRIRNDLA